MSVTRKPSDLYMPILQRLFDDNRDILGLSWAVAPFPDDRVPLPVSQAAADLVGYWNLVHPRRIQIFGIAEWHYFAHLDERRSALVLNELALARPPAMFVADALEVPATLLQTCIAARIPVLTSSVGSAQAIDHLRVYLGKTLAERIFRHGVLMDVLGVGVLITGESGLGKSELALELISRGHGLVADDVVDLAHVAPHSIEGRCPELLANLLEVRGLGLLDIKAIFGETAVRRKMRLKLIVHLVKRSEMESDHDRLPIGTLTEDVLGVDVRKVIIPVAAGRNIAVLLEAAVRNAILQLRGIDTMRDFMARQARAMLEDDQDDLH